MDPRILGPGSLLVEREGRIVEISARAVELLREIRDRGSIKAASEGLGLSYRGAVAVLRRAEGELGERLVVGKRGSGASLTPLGEMILEVYAGMRAEALSARNRVRGRVVSIERDGASALVTVEIPSTRLKALVTAEALEELRISEGDSVTLIIKAPSIAISK